MQPDLPNIEIEDSENFRHEENLSFEQVVIRQLTECLKEGSKEMSAGGIRERSMNGVIYSEFVPNQREIFINCCDMLRITLQPHIDENKKILKKIDEFDEEIEKLNKESPTIPGRVILSIKNERDEYKRQESQIEYNNYLQRHNDKIEKRKVMYYKQALLPYLSQLMKDLNYFKEKSFTGVPVGD